LILALPALLACLDAVKAWRPLRRGLSMASSVSESSVIMDSAASLMVLGAVSDDDCAACHCIGNDKNVNPIQDRDVGLCRTWCFDGVQDFAAVAGDGFSESVVINGGEIHGLVPVERLSAALMELSLMKGLNSALSLAARTYAFWTHAT
jgi:hypothetical protein